MHLQFQPLVTHLRMDYHFPNLEIIISCIVCWRIFSEKQMDFVEDEYNVIEKCNAGNGLGIPLKLLS